MVRPVLAASLVLLCAAAPATALPQFARSLHAPCARCHTSPPRLNAEGVRFLRGAWRTPGAGAADSAAAGTPQLAIEAELGIAFARTDSAAGTGRTAHTTGEFRQDLLSAHVAGALAPRVTFHVAASVDSAAGAVRVPAAVVRFADIAPRGALALQAGAWDAGLPFLADARRGTLAPYLAPVALSARGVELGGVRGGTLWALGEINSERTAAASGGRSFVRLEDTYAWVVQDVRGQLVGGRMLFARQDSDISWHAWLQRLQFQAAALLGGGRAWVIPAYTLDRFDDRPAPGIHQRHQYVLLETLVALDARSLWTLTARLEHEHVTPTLFSRGEDHDLEVLRLEREVAPAVRVALEGSHAGDDVGDPHVTRLDATVRIAY